MYLMKMKILDVLIFLPFLLFYSCIDLTSKEDARPNIIFIMADDHAVSAISSYNDWLSGHINTPNIDRIAN